jgi:hypothetical protein
LELLLVKTMYVGMKLAYECCVVDRSAVHSVVPLVESVVPPVESNRSVSVSSDTHPVRSVGSSSLESILSDLSPLWALFRKHGVDEGVASEAVGSLLIGDDWMRRDEEVKRRAGAIDADYMEAMRHASGGGVVPPLLGQRARSWFDGVDPARVGEVRGNLDGEVLMRGLLHGTLAKVEVWRRGAHQLVGTPVSFADERHMAAYVAMHEGIISEFKKVTAKVADDRGVLLDVLNRIGKHVHVFKEVVLPSGGNIGDVRS